MHYSRADPRGKYSQGPTVAEKPTAGNFTETVIIIEELEAPIRLPNGRRLVMVGPGEYRQLDNPSAPKPNGTKTQPEAFEPKISAQTNKNNEQLPIIRHQPDKKLHGQIRKVVRNDDGIPVNDDMPIVQLVNVREVGAPKQENWIFPERPQPNIKKQQPEEAIDPSVNQTVELPVRQQNREAQLIRQQPDKKQVKHSDVPTQAANINRRLPDEENILPMRNVATKETPNRVNKFPETDEEQPYLALMSDEIENEANTSLYQNWTQPNERDVPVVESWVLPENYRSNTRKQQSEEVLEEYIFRPAEQSVKQQNRVNDLPDSIQIRHNDVPSSKVDRRLPDKDALIPTRNEASEEKPYNANKFPNSDEELPYLELEIAEFGNETGGTLNQTWARPIKAETPTEQQINPKDTNKQHSEYNSMPRYSPKVDKILPGEETIILQRNVAIKENPNNAKKFPDIYEELPYITLKGDEMGNETDNRLNESRIQPVKPNTPIGKYNNKPVLVNQTHSTSQPFELVEPMTNDEFFLHSANIVNNRPGHVPPQMAVDVEGESWYQSVPELMSRNIYEELPQPKSDDDKRKQSNAPPLPKRPVKTEETIAASIIADDYEEFIMPSKDNQKKSQTDARNKNNLNESSAPFYVNVNNSKRRPSLTDRAEADQFKPSNGQTNAKQTENVPVVKDAQDNVVSAMKTRPMENKPERYDASSLTVKPPKKMQAEPNNKDINEDVIMPLASNRQESELRSNKQAGEDTSLPLYANVSNNSIPKKTSSKGDDMHMNSAPANLTKFANVYEEWTKFPAPVDNDNGLGSSRNLDYAINNRFTPEGDDNYDEGDGYMIPIRFNNTEHVFNSNKRNAVEEELTQVKGGKLRDPTSRGVKSPVEFFETGDWNDVPITVNPKRKSFLPNEDKNKNKSKTIAVTEYDIARLFADAPAESIHKTVSEVLCTL